MSVNQRKREQLGMPIGTASARLKKALMPRLLQKLGEDLCYRCGERIEEDKDLSVEHKLAWFDVDPALFWDLDNVAFSHLSCNVASRRKGVERLTGPNGTEWCSTCRRFLDPSKFGRMNKTNYTRPVKYRCNECRRAKGWEK